MQHWNRMSPERICISTLGVRNEGLSELEKIGRKQWSLCLDNLQWDLLLIHSKGHNMLNMNWIIYILQEMNSNWHICSRHNCSRAIRREAGYKFGLLLIVKKKRGFLFPWLMMNVIWYTVYNTKRNKIRMLNDTGSLRILSGVNLKKNISWSWLSCT